MNEEQRKEMQGVELLDAEDIADKIINKFLSKDDAEILQMLVSKPEWNIY